MSRIDTAFALNALNAAGMTLDAAWTDINDELVGAIGTACPKWSDEKVWAMAEVLTDRVAA